MIKAIRKCEAAQNLYLHNFGYLFMYIIFPHYSASILTSLPRIVISLWQRGLAVSFLNTVSHVTYFLKQDIHKLSVILKTYTLLTNGSYISNLLVNIQVHVRIISSPACGFEIYKQSYHTLSWLPIIHHIQTCRQYFHVGKKKIQNIFPREYYGYAQ